MLGSWTLVSSVEVEGALSGNQSNKYQNQSDGSVAKLTSVDLVFGINWVVDVDREAIFRRAYAQDRYSTLFQPLAV